MENYNSQPKPIRTEVTMHPDPLCDAYYSRGRDFPVNNDDASKGTESGADGTVDQNERQKAPRLNASDGYGPSVKGKEGRGFPTKDNGEESSDETPTFAGERSSGVALSLVTGQITKAASGDVKKDRIGE